MPRLQATAQAFQGGLPQVRHHHGRRIRSLPASQAVARRPSICDRLRASPRLSQENGDPVRYQLPDGEEPPKRHRCRARQEFRRAHAKRLCPRATRTRRVDRRRGFGAARLKFASDNEKENEMSAETKKVLELLAAGKISPEDAERLLDKLTGAASSSEQSNSQTPGAT